MDKLKPSHSIILQFALYPEITVSIFSISQSSMFLYNHAILYGPERERERERKRERENKIEREEEKEIRALFSEVLNTSK